MRIIAGKLKGSTLHIPKNKNTRPLKDLARESIFNLLDPDSLIVLENNLFIKCNYVNLNLCS